LPILKFHELQNMSCVSISSNPFANLVISGTVFPFGVRFVVNFLLAYIWLRNVWFHIPIRSPLFVFIHCRITLFCHVSQWLRIIFLRARLIDFFPHLKKEAEPVFETLCCSYKLMMDKAQRSSSFRSSIKHCQSHIERNISVSRNTRHVSLLTFIFWQ